MLRPLLFFSVAPLGLSFRTSISEHYGSMPKTDSAVASDAQEVAAEPSLLKTPEGKDLLDTLKIMSWNTEDFDQRTASKSGAICDTLLDAVRTTGVQVILLQEASSCDLLTAFTNQSTFKCLHSQVDKAYADMSKLVLGNLILYDLEAFEDQQYSHRALKEGWKKWDRMSRSPTKGLDNNGWNLADYHDSACGDDRTGWAQFRRGCRIGADMNPPGTALLYPKKGRWTKFMYHALGDEHGVNFVNVHLFSGAHLWQLTDTQKSGLRSFQFRSMLWRSSIWNDEDRHRAFTVYAGDFNTRTLQSLREITLQGPAYRTNLWCPLEGKMCDQVTEHDLKNTQGKSKKKSPLDHVVVSADDVIGNQFFVPVATSRVLAFTSLSDHAPVLVNITLTKKMKTEVDAHFPPLDHKPKPQWAKAPESNPPVHNAQGGGNHHPTGGQQEHGGPDLQIKDVGAAWKDVVGHR